MCYICEARGNVGKHYKEYQKSIAAAKSAIGPRRFGIDQAEHSFGDGKDWTKMPPKSKRLWKQTELVLLASIE